MLRKVQANPQKDRKIRAETAGMVVGALFTLDTLLVKETCIWMQWWYRNVKDHPPPPRTIYH